MANEHYKVAVSLVPTEPVTWCAVCGSDDCKIMLPGGYKDNGRSAIVWCANGHVVVQYPSVKNPDATVFQQVFNFAEITE